MCHIQFLDTLWQTNCNRVAPGLATVLGQKQIATNLSLVCQLKS